MSSSDFQFSPAHPAAATRLERTWFMILLLVGIGLRLYHLDSQSLWSDEGIQYFISSAESLRDVLERQQQRTFHNALSFLINHLFLQIQDSDFFLRLPSALFGIGTLPLAYLLARHLLSRTAALYTLLIFAISPFHIWYSQEARMYAPLLFAAILNTLVLLKALERNHIGWWSCYVGSAVLGLYLHVFMVIHLSVHALWLLMFHRRAFLTVIACGLIAAILAFPVTLKWGQTLWRRITPNQAVQAAVQAHNANMKDRVKIGWQGIPYAFFAYGAGFSLGPSVPELHENRRLSYLLRFLPSIAAVGLTWGLLLLVGMWSLFRYGPSSTLWLCLLGIVGTLAGVIALTSMTRFTFNVRYVIIAYPYCVFLLSAALSIIMHKRAWIGTLAILVLTAISVISLSQYFTNPRYAKENIRDAVRHWQATAETATPHLLSYSPAGGTEDAINRYLTPAEQAHHIRLSKKNTIEDIHHFFRTHQPPSVHLVLTRDWHQKREKAIRKTFEILDEQAFAGAKLLKLHQTE